MWIHLQAYINQNLVTINNKWEENYNQLLTVNHNDKKNNIKIENELK